MSNLDTPITELSRELFEQAFSGELATQNIKERSVVEGKILRIDSDNVIVDVGYKAEGSISLSEFKNEQGELTIEVGDVVEVYLDSMTENKLNLSKSKADQMKAWERINKIFKNNETITGRITHRVKGGLSVDIGVKAFLPGSQVDLRPVKNLEKLIDQDLEFRIIKLNRHRGNIVLSRRILLEEERKLKREETLKKLQIGNIMEGVVKNITEYGAFIDLGGIDGLLHVTDITYARISDPHEVVEVGQKMNVMILKYEPDTKRVSLGLKQTMPDPWDDVEVKYPIGAIVQGEIYKVEEFGVRIELEEGIEGLVLQSEISWAQRSSHPGQLYEAGQVVQALVLSHEHEHQKPHLKLSIRQLEEDPWDSIEDRYPVNAIIRGTVRNITDFGIFVGIEDGIDGLIHISDLSWSQRQRKPKDLYNIADVVEAKVLSIDVEKRRFSLSIKKMKSDPWLSVQARYFLGQRVQGKIVNQFDYGIFVEIEDGVEGLVHETDLAQGKGEGQDWRELYLVDSDITVEVRRIDSQDHKISLIEVGSTEESGVENFIAPSTGTETTLSDIFGELNDKFDD
jgi:small subunit ribosomal protein S1